MNQNESGILVSNEPKCVFFELLQLIIFTIEIIRAEISSGLVIVDQIFSIRLASYRIEARCTFASELLSLFTLHFYSF